MLADEVRPGGAHRCGVERQMEPADVARIDGGPYRAVEETVDIGARAGTVTRVEFAAHLLRPEHRERIREMRVDAAHPGARGALRFGVEVHHLAAGMDAAV